MSEILSYSSSDTIQDSIDHLRQIFFTGKFIFQIHLNALITLIKGKSREINFRKRQLERLHALVEENEEKFYEALRKDLNKPKIEALSGDIAPVLDECLYFLDVKQCYYYYYNVFTL
jgi:hypothetical protein